MLPARSTHHSDGVVEETFAKHHDVELLVDRHVLEHAEHGHGIHGRDDGGEQQVLLEVDVLHAERLDLAYGEERHADADAVPQGSHHGEPQHLRRRGEGKKKVSRMHDFGNVENVGNRPCRCSRRKAWWA